jgi:hypothetical protein
MYSYIYTVGYTNNVCVQTLWLKIVLDNLYSFYKYLIFLIFAPKLDHLWISIRLTDTEDSCGAWKLPNVMIYTHTHARARTLIQAHDIIVLRVKQSDVQMCTMLYSASAPPPLGSAYVLGIV